MNYCISRKKNKENDAGYKAPSDIVKICKSMGFDIIEWAQFPLNKSSSYKKLWLFIVCNLQWISLYFKTQKGDLILYQHPSYGYRISLFWCNLIQKKRVRLVALIHDLESLRMGLAVNYNAKTSNIADVILLNQMDYIICHNDKMKQYLTKNGISEKKIYSLEIFDYLYDGEPSEKKDSSRSLIIAGNLDESKCAYIYRMFDEGNNANISINLYGSNYTDHKETNHLNYHGSYSPNDLPSHLQGDFGIVWDGDDAQTCGGVVGGYLRYNNPHKTSLYLASGIPVITWSKAAISHFIIENKVGIVVDSLYELEDKIKEISDQEYQEMKEKAKYIGKNIRNGYYTKKAIESAMNYFSNKI